MKAAARQVQQALDALGLDAQVRMMALVSGTNRLDTGLLGAAAGTPVERADATTVREATGFAIGGVPPVGHATPLPVYCDRDLLAHDTVWAAAGTPNAVFPAAPGDLVRAAHATVCELAER